ELGVADARVDIRQVAFSAGEGDVARAIGKIGDAVEAKRLDPLCFRIVVQRQRPAFDRSHVLVGVEAEARDVAEGADVPALPSRSDYERRVLDDAQLLQ